MSQVYSNSKNEFIFGESGGKGKHLLSFLKNLSLTGSKDTRLATPTNLDEVNSSIYGSLAYNSAANSSTPSTSNGGGLSFANPKRRMSQRSTSLGLSIPQLPNHSPERSLFGKRSTSGTRRSSPKVRYADLDDDWDAGFEEVSAPQSPSPAPMLDSLYPDLTIVPPAPNNPMTYSNPRFAALDSLVSETLSKSSQLQLKIAKFHRVLEGTAGSINLTDLRKLSWNGIPPDLRAVTWQILLGYLPTNTSRQESTLKRKRQEYLEGIEAVPIDFSDDKSTGSAASSKDRLLYHQINIDVKRTHPTVKLYGNAVTQKLLRRILYLWAIRHPASGYVQGINDLCTPFFQLFLENYIKQMAAKKKAATGEQGTDSHPLNSIPGLLGDDPEEKALLEDPNILSYTVEQFDPALLSPRVLNTIEADTYWCLSRLLENITDNYIHEQPGIIRQVGDLRNLMQRIDVELLAHFEHEGIEFMQFAFRWMNCLLMRELPLALIVRMWDTYLSESPLGFNNFHVYVCAAFLSKFSAQLKQMEFQDILLFLQSPPTLSWTNKDVELMLSEAFIWQSLYKDATAHLK